ncbi:MAG: DUF853 family protein, partial [Planctomycetaceae bacterium]|nr:DUF853 family protein [Planctomycetaceae bacterium]
RLQRHVYFDHVNIDRLAGKDGAQQQNFVMVLRQYMYELASFLWGVQNETNSLAETLASAFGDTRRRVDVTIQVGPADEPVRVVGILDYFFFDPRTQGQRILDYKLLPAVHISDDLMQVCMYALMHHQQHGTKPGAGVLYLFPERLLVEKAWEEIWAERAKSYNLLASMREWETYDETSGKGCKPPGEPSWCDTCRWKKVCEVRLGPKCEGVRLDHWNSVVAQSSSATPVALCERSPEMRRCHDQQTHDAKKKSLSVNPRALFLGEADQLQTSVEIATSNLSTHTAIVGAAGSGKTWLAKVFIEEAVLQGVPVLAVDPQGDLVQFLKPQPIENIPEDQRERYRRFHELCEPRIFTPGTSHGIRLSLSPIRLPRESELNGLPTARRQEEYDDIINSVALHLVALTLKGRRSVEQQQTFLSQVLKALIREQSQHPLQLTDIAAAAHDPEGLGIEDADLLIKKTERENLGRQLYALAHGPMASLFSGGQALDIDFMKQPTQPGKVPLNVIYLNAVGGDAQKHAFLAAMANELYRWMSCSGGDPGSPQLLFSIDEARDFLPAGTSDPPAKRPVSRLFTQARKYGVGCMVCTQSPRSVDYNVFGNCSTKIIGRLETPQDSERVEDWFTTTGAKPAWVAGRAGADKGTFVARWPGQPESLEGAVFRSRHLYSLHEGAWSPERVEQEVSADSVHQRLRELAGNQ